jgi:hypothetical protein
MCYFPVPALGLTRRGGTYGDSSRTNAWRGAVLRTVSVEQRAQILSDQRSGIIHDTQQEYQRRQIVTISQLVSLTGDGTLGK